MEGVHFMMSEAIHKRVRDISKQIEGLAQFAGHYIENSGIESVVRGKIQSLIRPLWSVDIAIKKLDHFHSAELPKYQTSGASGFDVRAQLDRETVIEPGERAMIPTGLVFEVPEGYEIQVRPRSGWAAKEGVTVLNSPGTIDSDYRGEVKILLVNLGRKTVTIRDQDRVAQMVVCPVVKAQLIEAEQVSDTERGDGGFGSTGPGGNA
jgi:dUTP pyrophosphatase